MGHTPDYATLHQSERKPHMESRDYDRIVRYVPRRLKSFVQDAFRDSDGIWVWFEDCVNVFDGSSTLHCDRFSEIRPELSRAIIVK